jgi:hypothetical protein
VRSPLPVIKIVKTGRTEEIFKEESHDIDNSQSTTSISTTLTFTQKWSKIFKIEMEKSSSTNTEVKFGAKEKANFRVACEEKVRATYSITGEQEEITEREITFDVPAHSKLNIVVRFAYVLEYGNLEILRDKTVIQTPFQTIIGVNINTDKREERVS